MRPLPLLLSIAVGLLVVGAVLLRLERRPEPGAPVDAAPAVPPQPPVLETPVPAVAAPPPLEDPPLERLIALPEGFALPEDDRLPDPDEVPVVPVESLPEAAGSALPGVSVEGGTERFKGLPGEERELRGGVTVSPEDSPGDASLTVEGGVREEYSGRDDEPANRNNYGGVRITVPLPAAPPTD